MKNKRRYSADDRTRPGRDAGAGTRYGRDNPTRARPGPLTGTQGERGRRLDEQVVCGTPLTHFLYSKNGLPGNLDPTSPTG
jgi:hypothetical protein